MYRHRLDSSHWLTGTPVRSAAFVDMLAGHPLRQALAGAAPVRKLAGEMILLV